MHANPYQKYKKNQVEMASPAELTLLCFKGSIKNLKQLVDNWEEKKPEEIHEKLLKVQAILEELIFGLNEQAGEVVNHLASLYDYMQRRLVEANVKKDPEIIKEVLDMFEELKDTWEEAMVNQVPAAASSAREG